MSPRSWRIVAALTLIAWCVAMLSLRRAEAITDDWQGWRQADTQAIARSLAFEDFSPLHPRIDWRGDGPGYVETELQLYPALIAIAFRIVGESVWPGQLLSLLCVALAAWLLFAELARRFGGASAFVAVVAILGHQGTIAISTSIQPDALAFLAFTAGFIAFARWLESEPTDPRRPRLWWTWIVATTVAALVKPTTLELGIAQFTLVLLARRRALRDPRVWIGWAIVLAVLGAYLLHARSLYVTYGNTFGLLSGGDSKLPALGKLASARLWIELARYGITWGIGLPAAAAALYWGALRLAGREAMTKEPLALAAGAIALSVLALRYTSHRFGTHYHLPHAVLGAWLVAEAGSLLGRSRARLAAIAAFSMVLAASGSFGARSVRFLRELEPELETELGFRLAALAPPGTRVAVRARAEGYSDEWRTVNNFEDPRVFYLSRTHGWALPNDLAGAERLADYARRGARYYVHVAQKPIDAELAAWLRENATALDRSPAGEIYVLEPEGSSRTK